MHDLNGGQIAQLARLLQPFIASKKQWHGRFFELAKELRAFSDSSGIPVVRGFLNGPTLSRLINEGEEGLLYCGVLCEVNRHPGKRHVSLSYVPVSDLEFKLASTRTTQESLTEGSHHPYKVVNRLTVNAPGGVAMGSMHDAAIKQDDSVEGSLVWVLDVWRSAVTLYSTEETARQQLNICVTDALNAAGRKKEDNVYSRYYEVANGTVCEVIKVPIDEKPLRQILFLGRLGSVVVGK